MTYWANTPAPEGVEEAWGAWLNPRSGSLYEEPVKVMWVPSWAAYVAQDTEEEPTAPGLGFDGDEQYPSSFVWQTPEEVRIVIRAWDVYYRSLRSMFTNDRKKYRSGHGR